jgi:hypothetical protein
MSEKSEMSLTMKLVIYGAVIASFFILAFLSLK